MNNTGRIGPKFLKSSVGFGGSCFPKDVQALIHSARQFGLVPDLLEAVEAVNHRQKRVPFAKLQRALGGSLRGRTVAVWGLAFKAETDDMREAPAIVLIESLLADGATARARSQGNRDHARDLRGPNPLFFDNYACAEGADAVVIMTEWLMYRNPDFERSPEPQPPGAHRCPEPVRAHALTALGFTTTRLKEDLMRILVTGAAGFSGRT